MESTVKLYKNTGFDLTNIPDSQSLLNSLSYVTAPFVYIKQNIELSKIKIEKNVDYLLNVDYCQISDVYYFVTNITMLNNNVAELILKEDSITTLGGPSALNILDGWCTRKHVTTDTIFEHNVPEDFSPALPFDIDNYKMISDYSYSNNINLVLSTVDLTSTNLLKAEIFVGTAAEGDYNVTVPGLPPLSTESVIGIRLYNGASPVIKETKYPNIGIFDFNDSIVKESIRILRSLGLESVIVGCYKIPPIYIYELVRDGTIGTQTYGKINSLITQYISDNMSRIGDNQLLGYEYGTYVPSNKKVFSQFNNITIFSPTSGDSNNFELKDIYSNSSVPNFILTPDASNEGIPVCRPLYTNNQICNQYNWFLDSTRGSNWINTPITMREASGNSINAANYSIIKGNGQANWDRYTYQIGQQSNALNKAGNAISSTFGAVSNSSNPNLGGMFSASGQIASWDPKETVRALQDLARDSQSKILAYETQQNITAPQISFPQNVSLQLYYGNIFCGTTLRLQDADLERFDKYLTRYGYKVSEILTTDAFVGRQNFNFVEAIGVSISSTSQYASRERRINASKQLESGVRIWHVKPSETLIYTNPIL